MKGLRNKNTIVLMLLIRKNIQLLCSLYWFGQNNQVLNASLKRREKGKQNCACEVIWYYTCFASRWIGSKWIESNQSKSHCVEQNCKQIVIKLHPIGKGLQCIYDEKEPASRSRPNPNLKSANSISNKSNLAQIDPKIQTVYQREKKKRPPAISVTVIILGETTP